MPERSAADRPESFLEYRILRVAARLEARFADALGALGLTSHQFSVLFMLARDGDATAADLARSVFVTPQGVAKVVADLEQRGLVTRAGRRQRGRRTPVQLTPDGHVALARAESTVAALDAETHRHLGDAAAGLAAGLDRLEAWVLASDSARRQ
jgi:DNA-binding MarR family transcriptional regulator